MKTLSNLGLAMALGLLVAFGSGYAARAQQLSADAASIPFGNFNTFVNGIQPQARMPAQGTWAEVINVSSRWMVIQNEQGQQFPIASDRVRQFMIRWPMPTAAITNRSMLEVSGADAGSNVIVADHVDVFEDDAQALVTPSVNNHYGDFQTLPYGNFQTIASYGAAQQDPFGMAAFEAYRKNASPAKLHVVGHAVSNDPLQVAGFGMNWYNIQPSLGGLSITQVTVGTNTYARRGDLVYIVPENLSPRSLDVSQLVLYKKIPLRAFQP